MSRDPLYWPYPADSIWNMPIGASASFQALNGTAPSNHFAFRWEEDILIFSPDVAQQTIKEHDAGWSGADRCSNRTGDDLTGNGTVSDVTQPIPTGWDTTDYLGTTPNHSAGIVYRSGSDLRLFETQPFHICSDGVPISQFVNSDWVGDSILTGGNGVKGGSHGGAYMTAFGGTIRLGEWVSGGVIPHATKVIVNTNRWCADQTTQNACFRWPALRADSGAVTGYGSQAWPGLPTGAKMGMLVSLLASFDVEALQTEPAKILGRSIRDYGSYLVDGDAGLDVFMWAVEWSNEGRVIDEFEAEWGIKGFHRPIDGAMPAMQVDFLEDMRDIEEALVLVNDNSSSNVGGAGTRRAAMAPPFGDALTVINLTVTVPTPTVAADPLARPAVIARSFTVPTPVAYAPSVGEIAGAGSLWLETWSRPGSAVFERLAVNVPGPFNFTKRMAGGIGQGDMTVPATWDRINDVIQRVPGSPASDVRTLNRVFIEQPTAAPARIAYEWFNDVTGDESREDFTQIQGPGIESVMADGIVYPWDWDGLDESTSTFPDWVWGGKDVVGPVATSFAPHIFDAWISTGATGSFGIDVDLNGGGFQSASVSPGDSAATVEAAIEALSNVTDADVQGNGTEESPWRISITEPAGTWTVAIDSSGLSGGRGFTNLDQFGKLMPIGWTQSLVGSSSIPHGVLTDFRASLGGGGDPALPAGCDAWIVFLGQEWYFPGVQKRVRVTAGAPFQIPDDYIQLYAQGANADVRVIVRDMFEQEICSIELSLVSNTLTPVPGFTCMIPLGITEVVFRLGHIGTGTPPRIFMACPSMREGLAPTTAGGIFTALFNDATVDHVADGRLVWEDFALAGTTFLDLTFDVSVDSDGQTWDESELTFTAQRGKTYLQVLTDLGHLGYLWSVTPSVTSGRWDVNLYNPTWVNTDATTLETPAINIGSGVTGGPIFRSHLTGNVITVEGSQMQFGRSESAPSIAAIGRKEAYQPDRALLNTAMASIRAAEEVASRLLSGLSVSVTVDPVNGPVPLLDYDVDWLINVQIPPVLPKSAHRLASITVNVGETTQYKLAFSSEAFAGVQGVIEGVRRLMLKFEGLERPINEDIPTPITGGVGTMPTITFASYNSLPADQEKADYICLGPSVDNGTFIQGFLNAALAAAPTGQGRIVLLSGDYEFWVDPAVGYSLTLPPGWVLEGQTGYGPYAGGPYITGFSTGTPGADDTVIQAEQSTLIRGIAVDCDGEAIYAIRAIGNAANVVISECYIQDCKGVWVTSQDIWIQRNIFQFNQLGVTLDSAQEAWVTDNLFTDSEGNDLVISGGGSHVTVRSNMFQSSGEHGIYITGTVGPEESWIINNSFTTPGFAVAGGAGIVSDNSNVSRALFVIDNEVEVTDGVGIRLSKYESSIVRGNVVKEASFHGISLNDLSDSVVEGNVVIAAGKATTNTYDGIFIEGDSNRNSIQNNRVKSDTAGNRSRYGVNISAGTCDNNVSNDNVAGPSADFGTGAYNDAGTGTQGTNFTI